MNLTRTTNRARRRSYRAWKKENKEWLASLRAQMKEAAARGESYIIVYDIKSINNLDTWCCKHHLLCWVFGRDADGKPIIRISWS